MQGRQPVHLSLRASRASTVEAANTERFLIVHWELACTIGPGVSYWDMQCHRIGPETERTEHRAFTLDDCESFYRLNSHPEVMRYTGEPPLPSLDDARQAIADYPDFESVGYGRWACVLKETGAVIGFSGLKYLPELDEVDVGFRFFPEYWGQGIATETCSACIAFGFEVLKLDRILGLVLTENKASIRVLEKCGLTRNGEVTYDGDCALKYEIPRVAWSGI